MSTSEAASPVPNRGSAPRARCRQDLRTGCRRPRKRVLASPPGCGLKATSPRAAGARPLAPASLHARCFARARPWARAESHPCGAGQRLGNADFPRALSQRLGRRSGRGLGGGAARARLREAAPDGCVLVRPRARRDSKGLLAFSGT